MWSNKGYTKHPETIIVVVAFHSFIRKKKFHYNYNSTQTLIENKFFLEHLMLLGQFYERLVLTGTLIKSGYIYYSKFICI